MKLDHDDRTLLELATVGAAIAIGQLFVGGEKITVRLFAGRVIVGAALSMAAGSALAVVPDLPQAALVGIGSALGISGQSFLEMLVQRCWPSQQNPRKE